jgi:hypothetical protein
VRSQGNTGHLVNVSNGGKERGGNGTRTPRTPSHGTFYARLQAECVPEMRLSAVHARPSSITESKLASGSPSSGLVLLYIFAVIMHTTDTIFARGGIPLSIPPSPLSYTRFSPLHMAAPLAEFPARWLVRAVRAALRLVNESVDALDLSQSLAIRGELRQTLRIISRKITDDERAAGNLFRMFRMAKQLIYLS